jgi:hypothetical protein
VASPLLWPFCPLPGWRGRFWVGFLFLLCFVCLVCLAPFCFPCAVLASLVSIIGRNRLNLWSLSPTVIVHRVSKLVLRVMRACTRPSCQQPRRRATRHAEGRLRHCGGHRAQSVLLDWTSTERPRECYGKADREISSPFLPGRLPEIRGEPGVGGSLLLLAASARSGPPRRFPPPGPPRGRSREPPRTSP